MNITLLASSFIVLYLLGTLGIGVWAGSRIKTRPTSPSRGAACR